ncbi:hypothetical protein [Pelagicoccus sp. SDUM812005]|uniref:hypothetical protein n=1 Tax=Pelagicoccus sp. SDUM812005 TaxID=3041257 RepID=UPI0028107761|nr:hypothetical protein [Pelagicoccus sp. SDUM812005]MDQ8180037.1 hypothetical protein [Pelagicoccus sp. SDUM812005]
MEIRLLQGRFAAMGGVMLAPTRLLLGFVLLAVAARSQAAELEILRVDFDLVEQEGARDPWYEIAVAVSVEEGDRGNGANPRFADEVAVSLALATEVNRGGGRSFEFYAARVEYPTLEVGQHVVRFYLPPEIVKRDRVRGEPFGYEIEILSPAGLEDSLVSPNLERPEALQSFRSEAASRSEESREMRLQFETPFAWMYPRDTPSPRLKRP